VSSTAPARKQLRETTDDLIHGALLVNDLPELISLSGQSILCVAGVLLQYAQDPQVPDFVEAVQAHIESGRAVMDRGLMLNDWATARCGAVMLEITVRGVCAALSVPYDLILAEVHRAQQAGESPAIRRILTEAGVIKPESTDAHADIPR
jgi:hypothetical protein